MKSLWIWKSFLLTKLPTLWVQFKLAPVHSPSFLSQPFVYSLQEIQISMDNLAMSSIFVDKTCDNTFDEQIFISSSQVFTKNFGNPISFNISKLTFWDTVKFVEVARIPISQILDFSLNLSLYSVSLLIIWTLLLIYIMGIVQLKYL